MKYVKLFEGFLAEKKKKKEEEDPGTVLSNTTGIIATAEVSEDDVYGHGSGYSYDVIKQALDRKKTVTAINSRFPKEKQQRFVVLSIDRTNATVQYPDSDKPEEMAYMNLADIKIEESNRPKYGTDDEFSQRVSDWANEIMSMDDRTENPTTVVNAAGEKFAKAVGFKYIPTNKFQDLMSLMNKDEFGDTFDVYDKEEFLKYYKDYFTK